MQYAESVVDLIGNTPLVRLNSVTRDLGPTRAGQDRVPQPRRLRQGPHRRPHGRRRRGQRRAPARRHDRGADQREHRRRAGAGRPAARLQVHLRVPRQGRQDKRNVLARTAPRSSSAPPRSTRPTPAPTTGSPTASSARRGRLEARPVLEPGEPAVALRDHRPGALGGDGRSDHHLVAGVGTGGTISGIGRYLKEVSGGKVQVVGADPEGSVYSGGTGRPYLVEGVGEDFWPRPTTARSPTRSSPSPTPTRSR